jgi:hypothetical protein
MKKTVLVLLLLLLMGGVYVYTEYPRLNIISGFGAKNMCSCLYQAGRDQDRVTHTDNNFSPINIAKYQVDQDNLSVTASVYGMMKRTAVFHEDLGCQLLVNGQLDKQVDYFPVPHNCPPLAPFPWGNDGTIDSVFTNVNYNK